jgi:hypothetical protein
LLALVVVALVATSAVAFALTRGSGGELPDSIDGVPRMHTAEANAFEHVMDGMTMADMSLSGAMYGDGETPDLVLELISGVPAEARSVPMDVFFSQAGAGLAANSGGSVREAEAVEATDGGVEYRCAPLDLPPGAPGEAGTGVLCMWKAQDIGIVVTFRTGDPSAAVEDARLAYAAVG